MKLELVPVPVSDLERAKAFYSEKLGFNVDHDTQPSDTVRVIQLTPPGSACSIVIGKGLGEISEMKPGSVKGLHLVVKDMTQSRDLLISRGVTMGEVIEYLARELVDHPEEVRVTELEDGDRVSIRLDVAEDDWGKVIGKGGRIASSLRALVKVAAVREDVRVNLEIGD